MTTAATFSEELATCLEDSGNEEALNHLFSTCSKTSKTIKPLRSPRSRQASTEGQGWQAVDASSAKLKATLESLPDGDERLEQLLVPLKPANGYAYCAQFVNIGHQASRTMFWEMVADHVETIHDALQGCSLSLQAVGCLPLLPQHAHVQWHGHADAVVWHQLMHQMCVQ